MNNSINILSSSNAEYLDLVNQHHKYLLNLRASPTTCRYNILFLKINNITTGGFDRDTGQIRSSEGSSDVKKDPTVVRC